MFAPIIVVSFNQYTHAFYEIFNVSAEAQRFQNSNRGHKISPAARRTRQTQNPEFSTISSKNRKNNLDL
jgi:hypothetical protein